MQVVMQGRESINRGQGGSLCEPVLSHSWFSSIEVVGGHGSVHTIFGSISVRSAVLGSSWLVTSLPPTLVMCRQQPNEWVGANSFPHQWERLMKARWCCRDEGSSDMRGAPESTTAPFDRQTLEIIPYGIPFYCITIYIKVIL
jgi:hypothetical protein